MAWSLSRLCCFLRLQEMTFLPYESVGEVVLNKTYLVRIGAPVPRPALPGLGIPPVCGSVQVPTSVQTTPCVSIQFPFCPGIWKEGAQVSSESENGLCRSVSQLLDSPQGSLSI